MEFQMDFLGRDKQDLTAKLPPVRCSDDFKRDVDLLCYSMQMSYAQVIRLVLGYMITQKKTYPKEMRPDPMQEIKQAADHVIEYIPVIRRQMQYNPKAYHYENSI